MAGELIQATTKVYGNYRGLVEDNADPLKLGRCRIRIYPLFKDMEATVLPWSVPAMGLFDGAGNNIGSCAIPRIGSYVFCFFEAGDIYQPVYFAEAQTAAHGLPTAIATNYPNKKAWRTYNGIQMSIDDTEKIVRLDHPTGTYIEINEDGRVTVTSVEKVMINSTDNTEVDVGANCTVTVSGDCTVSADGNVIISGSTVSINP